MGFEKKNIEGMTPEAIKEYAASLTLELDKTESELEKKKTEIKNANAESAKRRVENETMANTIKALEEKLKGVEAKDETTMEALNLAKKLNEENVKFQAALNTQLKPALEKLSESQRAIIESIADPVQKTSIVNEFLAAVPVKPTVPPPPAADSFGTPHAGIITYENREAYIKALEAQAIKSKTPNDRMQWITQAVIPDRMRTAGQEIQDKLYEQAIDAQKAAEVVKKEG